MMKPNSEAVSKLYNKSHSWLTKCAYNFTRDVTEAEELLQEVYLYLLEMPDISKIKFGEELNLLYIYRIVKTKYLNSIHKKPNYIEYMDIEVSSGEYDIEEDQEFERLLALTQYELSDSGSLHWFDKKLLQVYIDEDHSLTSLSEATKISRSACWNSISKSKKYIKNKAHDAPKS